MAQLNDIYDDDDDDGGDDILIDTESEWSFGLRHIPFRSLTRGYHEDACTCEPILCR